MGKNIKLQLEQLQNEINRREAALKKLYKAKQMLEDELFQQENSALLKFMEQNQFDAAAVLKLLRERRANI